MVVVEVGVEQHDGAGQRVHGVVGLVGVPPQAAVALEITLTEVQQHPLSLLK